MKTRNTLQCQIVLDTVVHLRSHATADEIYQAIYQKHPTISRATVYRNLNRLAQQGKIRKLEIAGGPDHFDHCCHDHVHVKCEKCGQVFDVDMDFVSGLEQQIRDPRGFEFTRYDIIFHGICPACKHKANFHF